MSGHCFKAIQNFVCDLGEFFSSDLHSLALYERLLTKTTASHTEAVEKHIQCFKKFLSENEEVILNLNGSAAAIEFTGIISYSPKVYIDMNAIFKLSMEADTKNAIIDHLLTLSALLNSSQRAKDALKTKTQNQLVKVDGEGEEEDFLNQIISKVEKHVSSDTTNPQDALSSIMGSGMIPELVSSLNTGISSGKLDLNKMMNSVQKMVGSIAPEAQNDPNLSNAMGMLSNMMGMMNMKQ